MNSTSNVDANITSLPENNPISTTIPDNTSSNKLNASYYLDTTSFSTNGDIYKIQNEQVKILKAQKIDIHTFITDICVDKVDNIVLTGRIENQTIQIKYNKYLIGMHLI